MAGVTGGPVLELGCGTGRLTRPMAAIGYEVVGLDNDAEMLGWSAAGVELVEADMRAFDLGRTFPLVVVPYNSLQLLTTVAEQRACVAAIVRHLRPDGLLALEVTDFITGVSTDVVPAELLATAEGITLYGSLVTDSVNRLSHYERRFVFDDSSADVTDHVTLRAVDEADLATLAVEAGLSVVECERDGRRLAWVARAPSTTLPDR